MNITELEIALARDPGSDAFIPLCEAYLASGRTMEAMVLGKKAVKARPEDKTRRLLLARVYAEQGKLPKAMDEVNALLKVDGAHSPSHLALGRYQEKAGQKDEAIKSFKAAVDLDDNAEARAALLALGVTYEKAKPPPPPPPPAAAVPQHSGVRPALTPQRSVPPGGSAVRQPRVSAVPPPATSAAPLSDSAPAAEPPAGEAPAAEPAPRPVRRRRPAAPLTEEDLGIHAKPPAQSNVKTTMVVAVVGVIVLGILVIGMTLYRSKQDTLARLSKPAREQLGMDSLVSLRKAQTGFEEMLKVSSGQPMALGSLAYIHAIMYAQYGIGSEKDPAEKAVAAAERGADDVSLTHVARSMLQLKAGKADEAHDLLEKIAEKLGESPAGLIALGDVLMAQGKVEEAGKAYQSARERSGAHDARGYWAMGEFLRQVGRERDAMANLDSVIRVDSEHVPARLARALIRLEMGGPQDAVAAQTDLLRLGEHPETLGPFYGALADVARVDLARITGAPPQGYDPKKWDAKAVLEEARKGLGAANPDLMLVTARIELDNGRAAEATKILKDLVSKNPARLPAQLALGRALMADGKFQELEAAMEKAMGVLGKNVDIMLLVAQARREKGNLKGAEDQLKKANEIARDHPRIQLELAKVHTEQKKFPEALKLLESAIEGSQDRPSQLADVFCQTAATLLAQGNDKLAATSLDEAAKADPSFAPIHYWRGMVLKGGKTTKDDARAAFSKYLEKAPRGEFAARAAKERDALK